MGAKKLKAIAVRGTKPINVYDPEKILEFNKKTIELRSKQPAPQPQGKDTYTWYFLGSDAGIVGNYEGHAWRERPDVVKGFQAGYIGDYFYTKYGGCFGCPYACTPLYTIPGIGAAAYRCYASFWPWQLWQTDMKITFEGQRLMSDYGLESREMAVDVAWLMQLYNEGVITAKDTDGIPFERGSKEAFFSTIHKVAKREGFGDILANGPVPFAKKLGSEAEKRLIHNKGVTMRTFDYRLEPGTALGEAICARGNSHRASPYRFVNWEKPTVERGGERYNAEKPDAIVAAKKWAKKMFGTEQAINPIAYEGKPRMLIFHMHEHAIMDSIGFCEGMARIGVGYGRGVNLDVSYQFAIDRFTAATGTSINEKQLMKYAEGIINVERACVVRDGRTRTTDTIPEFFFNVGIADGPWKGRKLDKVKFEKMQNDYYLHRGWDIQTGLPTRKKLEELNLKEIAYKLEKLGKLANLKKA
jgi:aldehyde:ferredoxin oxidoreductase